VAANRAARPHRADERRGRVRGAAVLGTVWGGWGLLLAFPIMAAIKIVCGEVERLKPLAVFMSD